jgi:hypothetical protein
MESVKRFRRLEFSHSSLLVFHHCTILFIIIILIVYSELHVLEASRLTPI